MTPLVFSFGRLSFTCIRDCWRVNQDLKIVFTFSVRHNCWIFSLTPCMYGRKRRLAAVSSGWLFTSLSFSLAGLICWVILCLSFSPFILWFNLWWTAGAGYPFAWKTSFKWQGCQNKILSGQAQPYKPENLLLNS